MDQVGLRLEQVRLLIITHAHFDHWGQALPIVERTGCEMWVHPASSMRARPPRRPRGRRCACGSKWRARAASPRSARAPTPSAQARSQSRCSRVRSARPARLVDGVQIETDLGRWHVYETPGHAASHVCLYQPEHRLLISGDHLLGRIVLWFDRGDTPDPVGEYLRSLDVVSRLRRAAGAVGSRQAVPRRAGPHRGLAARRTRRSTPRSRRSRTVRRTALEVARRGQRRAPGRIDQRGLAAAATLCYLATWSGAGRVAARVRRRARALARRRSLGRSSRQPADANLDTIVSRLLQFRRVRIDQIIEQAERAALLLRVLPAEDRRRRAGPRARARVAAPALPRLRLGHLRRRRQHARRARSS